MNLDLLSTLIGGAFCGNLFARVTFNYVAALEMANKLRNTEHAELSNSVYRRLNKDYDFSCLFPFYFVLMDSNAFWWGIAVILSSVLRFRTGWILRDLQLPSLNNS